MSELPSGPLGGPEDEILDEVTTAELGEAIADVFRRTRREEEARYRAEHPDEGLRERKRRLTRQLISDAATALFASRGFDTVKVSEIAERVGVSEKTIYNYFPSKEAMVLDGADDLVATVVAALRNREPGVSITEAVVTALDTQTGSFEDEFAEFVLRFVAMIESNPSLHAHWLEVHARLARVAAEELAVQAGVDPRDPEPMVAGQALVGLVTVGMESRVRRTEEGLRGEALHDAIGDDVRRAARLIDTGLWSFNLPRTERSNRSQAQEAMRAAEEARKQVVTALREARAAWEQARDAARGAGDEARRAGRQAHEEARAAGQRAREDARRTRQEAQREAKRAQHERRHGGG